MRAAKHLEIIYHKLGVVPTPLFDTQIAASVLGHPQQIRAMERWFRPSAEKRLEIRLLHRLVIAPFWKNPNSNTQPMT